jgi:hypothetical protein
MLISGRELTHANNDSAAPRARFDLANMGGPAPLTFSDTSVAQCSTLRQRTSDPLRLK